MNTDDELLAALAWNYMFGHVGDPEGLARRARELIARGAKLPSDPGWYARVWAEVCP